MMTDNERKHQGWMTKVRKRSIVSVTTIMMLLGLYSFAAYHVLVDYQPLRMGHVVGALLIPVLLLVVLVGHFRSFVR